MPGAQFDALCRSFVLRARPPFSICPQPVAVQSSRPFSKSMSKPKVLVADPVSERGIAELQEGGLLDVTVKTGLKEDELLKIIGEFDGLVVRSQTKVNAKVIEAAKNLKVVGRAGVGVDNVDVEAAT